MTMRMGLALGFLLAAPALASPSSMPMIESESPQPIAATAGPVKVIINGHDLAADLTQGHPYYQQYTHIWVRSVSAGNQAGAWMVCQPSNGCFLASGGDDILSLQFDGARWASAPGSHIQLHFWKGFNTAETPEPVAASGPPASPWSRIVTWDIAPSTVTMTITATTTAPPSKPVIKKSPAMTNLPQVPGH